MNALRDHSGESLYGKLCDAMNWVIPPDGSPGAGDETTPQALLALIADLGLQDEYAHFLPSLTEADLANPSHPFAPKFIEHVRDVYYASPESGAWEDIGFRVTA